MKRVGRSSNALSEWRSFGTLPFSAALGYATSVLHLYSIGPFIQPLQHQFGWSRAQISAGFTLAAVGTAAFSLPTGMLIDRIGPRHVGLTGVLLMSGAFALLGTATGGTANWFALWGIIAVASFGVQPTIWTSAVATRFDTSRGLAFAITLSGASASAAVFPILATWLIRSHGWRTAFAAIGGIWAAVVFPVLLLLFRGAQDQGRQRRAPAHATVPQRAGFGLSEGLRSAAFYKLLMASGLFAFIATGTAVHFVPILTASGTAPLRAAAIASLLGIFSIVGRLGTGVLLDRLPGHLVGAVAFAIPTVSSALLLLGDANTLTQVAAAAIFGLTLGSEVDVIAYLTARHFGLKSFGALYGALVMALALGTAFGPLAAGAAFDRYRSYAPFLVLTTVLMAASALALLSLGPPQASRPRLLAD